jgi:hypothetical protein
LPRATPAPTEVAATTSAFSFALGSMSCPGRTIRERLLDALVVDHFSNVASPTGFEPVLPP